MNLKILTFNWHAPYICLLAKLPHQFFVVEPEISPGNLKHWESGMRPLPENVRCLSPGGEALQMQMFGERILRIDKRMQEVGNIFPVLKPLTDMFQKRKENNGEESIAEMALFSEAVYKKLTNDCVEMVSLLQEIEEEIANSNAEETQLETSISALVPGR
jgi:hypothetical protein